MGKTGRSRVDAQTGRKQRYLPLRHVVLADFAESSDSSPASQATPFCEDLLDRTV